jgi:hypothetical protein
MAENRTNRVFVRPAGKGKSDSDTGKISVDGLVMKKIAAGMNSGNFEQTIKAYAMFDRISKGQISKGRQKTA